ncbi:DUF2339 domain-containing protein [Mesorhizobium australicum]|uniref:Uncharacterized membrane protein n=1 Tax=Mesorhizobium australicum TaxID=536018 RepID=A0A1X7P0M1_9HYPH|nr:DUF2339 domain-containing protein [Mesorhizobium australicum]SMH43675.1 Uncharacterized membrane protein [Mesorhizobium australicum]
MFDGFIGTIAIVALIYFVFRLYSRVGALETEVGKLRAVARQQGRDSAADPLPSEIAAYAPELADQAEDEAVAARVDDLPSDEDAEEPAGPWARAAREAAEPEAEPAATSEASKPAKPDIETALGTRWAVWVGGLALAFGAVFLIRYSIEAGIFGPRVRLSLAALLGILLVGAGEFVRRTGFRVPVQGAAGAYVPGILTAAGAFALFGTVYAAHGIYGFIGPAASFILLGVIGVGTIAAALVHGQALAGVGLLGSLLTPMLVASQAPSPWSLFGYLAIVLAANTAVARIRSWSLLASAGILGAGVWSMVYLAEAFPVDPAPVLFIQLVVLAALVLLWFRGRTADEPTNWRDTPSIAAALTTGLSACALLVVDELVFTGSAPWGAALVAAMVAAAWLRSRAVTILHAAGLVAVVAFARVALAADFSVYAFDGILIFDGGMPSMPQSTAMLVGILLSLLFLALGLWTAFRAASGDALRSASWSLWAAAVSVTIVAALWFAFGYVDRDYRYAFAMLALAGVLMAGAEMISRRETPALAGGWAVSFALAGAFAAAVVFVHAAFGTLLTTILCGLLALAPAFATRLRSWPALGWLCVAAVAVTIARILPDPTIIGASRLGTMPVFNALLPGYGLPALAFIAAAWQLGRTTGGAPRIVMEAAAALFALLTVAMLVRHAMNAGIIDGAEPRLAEQAIYTLIALGAGAILIALDLRSPSPVFRYGSMAAGVVSVLLIVAQHFGFQNPLFTNESVGPIPFIDLILLGYLLPGLAAAAVAAFARNRRPAWYVAMLALLSATLIFAWATLALRRLFHGEYLGLVNGMGQVETYAYSALWLAIGVLVLVVGVRLRSQVLRIASAVVIAVAVGKVFLFDMSELEGVLRALSFIGLGAVLIGIGLFYQRLLVRSRTTDAASAEVTPPAPAPGDRPAVP